jgi:SIR2-like domain
MKPSERQFQSREGKLERLAARVTAGEVVFFIGAGFSLESEHNSTQVLIARLLARIEGLCEAIAAHFPRETVLLETVHDIRRGLGTTFWLKEKKAPEAGSHGTLFDITEPPAQGGTAAGSGAEGTPKPPSILKSNLETLARNYYLINDWTCTSFERLISSFADLFPTNQPSEAFIEEVNRRENSLLANFHAIDPFKNTWKLGRINFQWLFGLYRDSKTAGAASQRPAAGKALFLETLGFLDAEVMAGEPTHPCFRHAAESSRCRLGRRHHVLSWLAAEGLSPTLVTTNYDLLIECAYRSAGLLPTNPPPSRWVSELEPIESARQARLPINSRYPCYTRIASAVDFFGNTKTLQSALIHKMHGCVESYRIAREKEDYAMARSILPTIVFTFREIQNWRDDAWSRDFLSTLLRTRTVVFAGYSGADPVVHDTFRTVYEEMARQSALLPHASGGVAPNTAKENRPERSAGGKARAFFLDQETQREFYALEILRSASLAERDPSQNLSEHANLLTFFTIKDKVFPNLDELFTWLFHLVARHLQERALLGGMQRLAVQLFGRPCPESELNSVLASFRQLRRREHMHAVGFDRGARQPWSDNVRRRFLTCTGWTSRFLVRLLHEFELGMSLLSKPGESYLVESISRLPWYRPIMEHLEWTAWVAVLELAIRHATAVSMRRPGLWSRPGAHLEVASADSPTVLFRAGAFSATDRRPPVRRCIAIQLSTLRQIFRAKAAPRQLTAMKPIVWSLRPGAIPWWADNDPRLPKGTPSASVVWQWAALPWERWPAQIHPDVIFGSNLERDRALAAEAMK